MTLTKFLAPALALAGSVVLATPALADTIVLDSSSIGKSYSSTYNGFVDGTPQGGGTTVSGLGATTTFKLTSIDGNSYTFDYSVANTTTDPVNSRVSSFGFNTDPTISGATSTGAFGYAEVGSGYPNGIGSIDVCFKDATTGSCQGGSNGGLTDGQTGTGSFTLSFSSPVSSLTLGDFYVRYQSVENSTVTSASGYGTNTSTTTGGTPVPEPGMLGMFGGALVMLGAVRYRRRRAIAAG